MILIDAIYINNGGGKVLLEYLIEKLEETNLIIHYLFDDRFVNNVHIKETNKITILKPSLSLRKDFYVKHKKKINKAFILGNVPPPIILRDTLVYTYFHNSILIKTPKEFSLVEKLKYILKVYIVRKYSRNTNYWLVQSDILKKEFIKKFKEVDKTIVLAFFPELNFDLRGIERINNTFLYVSNAQANKNHFRLIDAYCKAFDVLKKGKLIVTVNENFPEIIEKINFVKEKGYPIENIGFVDRKTLAKVYMQSEFVIFPSLTESFGLGLIEGVKLGCKIIGADLPYTYAVCKPSLVFNPTNVDSMSSCIQKAMQKEVVDSELKIHNQINDLLNLLKN